MFDTLAHCASIHLIETTGMTDMADMQEIERRVFEENGEHYDPDTPFVIMYINDESFKYLGLSRVKYSDKPPLGYYTIVRGGGSLNLNRPTTGKAK